MGNQITVCDDEENRQSSKLSKFFKSKMYRGESNQNDNFIVKYCQNNKSNDNEIDIDSFDQRRVVFVSLWGLYSSWKKCPSIVLYTALCLMPLKKQWVYNPQKYLNEIQCSFLAQSTSFSDIEEIKEFIQLLKWKDSQGLVLWMLDEYQYPNKQSINELVSPFWYQLNAKLCTLYDPITRDFYKQINFDTEWWKNKQLFKSKFNTKITSILSELFFLKMNYSSMQEIIYQSNPSSLKPIVNYSDHKLVMMRVKDSEIMDLFEEDGSDETTNIDNEISNNGEWFISEDYDPYDIENDYLENCQDDDNTEGQVF